MYTKQYIAQIAILLPVLLSLVYILLFKVFPDIYNLYMEFKKEQKEELNNEYQGLLQDLEIANNQYENANKYYIDAACFNLLKAHLKLDNFIKESKGKQGK